MLYLEDYLEIIENLPAELRDKFTLMRELDLHVNNEQDKLEAKIEDFFRRAPNMQPEAREKEFQQLKQEYYKISECADEKKQLSNQLYDLVEKYVRRLDHELHKFKLELEADNQGITEILEKRALESDNVSPSNNNREKRKSTGISGGFGKYNNNNLTEKTTHHVPLNGYNVSGMNNLAAGGQINKQQTKNSSFYNHNINSSGATAASSSFDNNNCLSFLNTKLSSSDHKSNLKTKLNLSGQHVIAAAAQQAIVATQQMPYGRRTASLKASIEAINTNSALSLVYMDDGSEMSAAAGSVGRQNNNGLEDQTEKTKRSMERINRKDRRNRHNFGVSEERYCYCNSISYGEMIFCENPNCNYKWFHYACVDITVAPEGSWYCPTCSEKRETM